MRAEGLPLFDGPRFSVLEEVAEKVLLRQVSPLLMALQWLLDSKVHSRIFEKVAQFVRDSEFGS